MTTNLKGFTSVFQYTISNDILDGLVEFFDWALLEKGNYFNVSVGELAPNGADYSRLRPLESGTYDSGQAWEGFKDNWVWQTGVNYSPKPITTDNSGTPGISGVYIDDIFYSSSTSGQYSHYVDYQNGRIVFDSPISSTAKVQAEYSYKWINVTYAGNLPWLRHVQQRNDYPYVNFVDNTNVEQSMPSDLSLQLPMIAIEVVPKRTFRGYQLGGGQWIDTDVIFHCVAEDEVTRNKLVDIVSLQNDKTINLFNTNEIHASGSYSLDYRGMPVSGALEYPQILNDTNYYGGNLYLKNTVVQNMDIINSNIYGGIVRMTTEGVKTNI